MATIDPRFIVNLKGRDYPTWPGVLDAATKAGLKTLETELVQIPTEQNGNIAIVQATAAFEDGRLFTDYGDAGPKTCSPQIALAAIRMASTRAKGRCLRDAINCGMTLLEELPDDEREDGMARAAQASRANGTEAARREPASAVERGAAVGPQGGVVANKPPVQEYISGCEPLCTIDGCGTILSPYEVSGCFQKGWPNMCKAHATEHVMALRAAQRDQQEAVAA